MDSLGVDVKRFYNNIDYSLSTTKRCTSNINIKPYLYNNKKYILFDQIIQEDVYNEVLLDKDEQNKKITKDYSIEIIKKLHNYYKPIKSNNGYILIIQWGSKNFLKKYTSPDSHLLCYICPEKEVENLSNFQISIQEFLDNITILSLDGLSGKDGANRIKIKL